MKQEQIDKCLKEKILFIDKLNELVHLDRNSIDNVKLDIFEHPVYGTQEYLVITFKGGAISARVCNANSNLANLEQFTKLCFGGYYSEVGEYKKLKEESKRC